MSPSIEKSAKVKALLVREMRAPDVSEVGVILQQSPEAMSWPEKTLLEHAAKDETLVAEQDGSVVGVLIGRRAMDEFEILNLAVRPSYRRLGVGAGLVHAALKRAYSAGANRTYLELRASNLGAFAFYGRLGFQVCGRRANYYREPVVDAIVLVLHREDQKF